jgi:hypothetical protein
MNNKEKVKRKRRGNRMGKEAVQLMETILNNPALVAVWDFQEEAGEPRLSQGKQAYALQEMSEPIQRVNEGVLGDYSAKLEFGQWLNLPRKDCPELNFHGASSDLTIVAWVKRSEREDRGCQAVAGMWNESKKQRQYCMFLDLQIWDSKDQVGGHVSAIGGPTPGYKYCMTTALGSTPVSMEEWHCLAFTYDGTHARCYLDGKLDEREAFNPYLYEGGLFDGGEDGADFTVGAVDRSGVPGNFYSGLLGGLAVFNRALSEHEIADLHRNDKL